MSSRRGHRPILAVLDLNIIISAAIVPRGPAFAVWHSWVSGQFQVCISEGMLIELAGKLAGPRIARRYRVTSEDVLLTVQGLQKRGILVEVQESEIVPVTGDPEDDLVLATARLGRADYLVTRDRRLLNLLTHASTSIIEPGDFLAVLARPAE